MTDVLSGSIGIEVEQRPLRPLRQRGSEQVPESRAKVWRVRVAIAQDAAYLQQRSRCGKPRIPPRKVFLREPKAPSGPRRADYSAIRDIDAREVAGRGRWYEG